MNALLAAAVLSLMLPIRMETGLILVRPFEFLIALGLLGWPLIAARRGVRVPVGLLLLLPYLTWHVASATVGGPRNMAREALQVIVVTVFAFLVAQEAPRLDVRRFSRRLLLGIAAIALGTIVWHIAHGYWVGWKQIPDPRLSFVFLPVVLAGLILFAEAERRRRLYLVWAGLSPVLLLSGERKALVIYLILSALLFARGRLALIVPALAAAFVGLLLLSTVVENPYLQKQIRTLVEPGGSGNYEYVLATGRYLPGDTPSDVQRSFALHVSRQMFEEHPLRGVGTNQYEAIVAETYPNAPVNMRLGIHGEFQRILTENGLVGFFLYALIWAAAWVRLARVLRNARESGRLTSAQARLLPLLVFIPLALFVGTEASGTRAFVGVIAISLLPELVSGALSRAPQPLLLRSAPVQAVRVLRLAGAACERLRCNYVPQRRAYDRTGGAECGRADVVRPRTRNHHCQRRVAGWVANLARGAGYESRQTQSSRNVWVGAAGARNAGLREAQGLFIALLDGDDYWAPEKLAHQLPAFSHRNKIGLVYSDFVDFSRDDVADGRIITVRRFDPTSPYQLRDYFLNDRSDHAVDGHSQTCSD